MVKITTHCTCVVIYTICVNFMIIIFETQAEIPKCIKLNDAVVYIETKETVTFFSLNFSSINVQIIIKHYSAYYFLLKIQSKISLLQIHICLSHISYLLNYS